MRHDTRQSLTRRHILGAGVAATAVSAASARARTEPTRLDAVPPAAGPLVVTSWDFGPGANDAAWPILADGGSALDAVEAAVTHVELLPDEFYVGYGGVPNAEGETTLDAMVMWGPTHDVGAVGCLKRVKRALAVARKVMEDTQHSLLVGDDATRFAAANGFEETSLTNLASQKVWEEFAAKGERSDAYDPEPIGSGASKPFGHDTVGTMAVDRDGNVCVGCSTNGRTFKIPGRVGDSPVAGAGAYCDNEVGAAIATGNGDVMMRFLPTYHTVELMREGVPPQEAAAEALRRILVKGYRFDGGVVALRRDGAHGGAKAGWDATKLSFAVRDGRGQNVVPAVSVA